MNYKRVFLVLLDSVGIGEAPDAADFGDVGANTIRTISKLHFESHSCSSDLYHPMSFLEKIYVSKSES